MLSETKNQPPDAFTVGIIDLMEKTTNVEFPISSIQITHGGKKSKHKIKYYFMVNFVDDTYNVR